MGLGDLESDALNVGRGLLGFISGLITVVGLMIVCETVSTTGMGAGILISTVGIVILDTEEVGPGVSVVTA